MQEKIFNMLFDDKDITWQNMIFDAVRSEQMDPWDVDIFALSSRFMEMLKQLKEMDFSISGKIILAAAILVRIKSHKLITDDIGEFDRLIAMSEHGEEEFYEDLEEQYLEKGRILTDEEKLKLIPRTPQPRKRKVSVYDLVDALQKALEVKKRRLKRYEGLDETDVTIPEKKMDVSQLITNVYDDIVRYFEKRKAEKMTFSQLLKSDTKEDKIHTFIPLLHLTTQGKVDIDQEYHLSEIDIFMLKNDKPIEPVKEGPDVNMAEEKS